MLFLLCAFLFLFIFIFGAQAAPPRVPVATVGRHHGGQPFFATRKKKINKEKTRARALASELETHLATAGEY